MERTLKDQRNEPSYQAYKDFLKAGFRGGMSILLSDHNLTIENLPSTSDETLLSIPSIGPKRLQQIRNTVADYYSPEEPETFSIGPDWEQNNQAILDVSDHNW